MQIDFNFQALEFHVKVCNSRNIFSIKIFKTKKLVLSKNLNLFLIVQFRNGYLLGLNVPGLQTKTSNERCLLNKSFSFSNANSCVNVAHTLPFKSYSSECLYVE